jgi:hypothetical protein
MGRGRRAEVMPSCGLYSVPTRRNLDMTIRNETIFDLTPCCEHGIQISV